jgi:hypothetical protein
VIFGHAGDAHVHVNPLIDVSRPDWREHVDRILDAVVSLVASLGGTLTGEHGDGRLRTPFLPRVWPPRAIEDFTSIKRAFDPKGILNPGVKVSGVGARESGVPGLGSRDSGLGDVKYDPSLPPLPERARAALDVVERDRAYSRFRLDLLDEAK